MSALADEAAAAVASIAHVSSRIEDVFAEVGDRLGRGHAIFGDLNQDLAALSGELSGAEIEGASRALQEIAARLNGLAEALPAESALLDRIGSATSEAAALLKPLFKHLQMITVIARSARIEAASLDGDRGNFLAFTQEAYDLGKAVQRSIEGCARDQERLADAVQTALNRQQDFEGRYRAQLGTAGDELVSAYAGMKTQRQSSVALTGLAGSSTRKIAQAVGLAIVSLQAGDSTRQRLEHVCEGLRLAAGPVATLAPALPGHRDGSPLLGRLQAAQLKDAHREFDGDIGQIVRSFSAILSDANAVVGHGRSLYGGEGGDSASFLARVKQTLAQASTLIASCESAGRSVDDALAIVEDTLGKFRQAIAGLSEAVVDLTLIGMNAGLKAGHLGSKGNAFVVIANELKTTADQVAAGAARLQPVLDGIEGAANSLRELRVDGDPTQLAKLEPSILNALREIEAGNARLGRLIDRLVDEGASFEAVMNSALQTMQGLADGVAKLPSVAERLDTAGATAGKLRLEGGDSLALEKLHAGYTMERERQVHREFLQRAGLAGSVVVPEVEAAPEDDGVELF